MTRGFPIVFLILLSASAHSQPVLKHLEFRDSVPSGRYSVTVQYPVLQLRTRGAARINGVILGLCVPTDSALQKEKRHWQDPETTGDGCSLHKTVTYDVHLLTKRILSVTLMSEECITDCPGGSGPCRFFWTKNYDVRTGKELMLEDIFEGDYLRVLLEAADQFHLEPDYRENLSRNYHQASFFLTDDHRLIVFTTVDYWIKEVPVLLSDLKPFIRKNGPLRGWKEKKPPAQKSAHLFGT